jgi:hypothetical protein
MPYTSDELRLLDCEIVGDILKRVKINSTIEDEETHNSAMVYIF